MRDLFAAGAAVICAAGLNAFSVPSAAPAVVTAIAVALVLVVVVRRSQRDVADVLARAIAVILVVGIALGFVLNFFPFGVNRAGWSIGLAASALAARPFDVVMRRAGISTVVRSGLMVQANRPARLPIALPPRGRAKISLVSQDTSQAIRTISVAAPNM